MVLNFIVFNFLNIKIYRSEVKVMKVSEAFDSGLIPESYVGIIPLKCKCGADIEVNESLTQMWCPSDKCTYKQIARMNNMLTNFDVKDIGESYCGALWNEMCRYGLGESHMNVFLLPYNEYPEVYGPEITLKKFNNIQAAVKDSLFNGGYSLGELVSKMSLPYLDINARKLFYGFNTIQDMQRYASRRYSDHCIYRFLKDRFGGDVSVRKILHTLSEFYDDIIIAQKIFGTKKAVFRQIKVSITGRITNYGSYTRKEFVRVCNKLCDGVAEIVDVSPSSEIVWVIADNESDSSKYLYGEDNNILISSTGFVRWLQEEVIQ